MQFKNISTTSRTSFYLFYHFFTFRSRLSRILDWGRQWKTGNNTLKKNLPHRIALREKYPYSEFPGPYFPTFGLNTHYLSVFSPNVEKYGPEKLRIGALSTQCRK